MFAKTVLALCFVTLAFAEKYTAKQKEDLSVKLIETQRSVDFHVKIAHIELEMQLFGVQAGELSSAKDDAAKQCIKDVTEKAVQNQNQVLDATVGKAQPELAALYQVIMSDSHKDSDWDSINNYLESFDLSQYKKETKQEFMSKLEAWLNLQDADMKACLSQ